MPRPVSRQQTVCSGRAEVHGWSNAGVTVPTSATYEVAVQTAEEGDIACLCHAGPARQRRLPARATGPNESTCMPQSSVQIVGHRFTEVGQADAEVGQAHAGA